MIEKLRHLLLLLLTTICLNTFGQEGTPLITNFSFGESSIDNESWAMAQDFEGQMLFANRRGIVTFDGIKWNTIQTPSVPLSLYFDPMSAKIFVGCKNNLGFLQKEDNGVYKYVSINTGKGNVGEIEHVTAIHEDIYFYSSISITRYSSKTKEIKQWNAGAGEPYSGFIINNGNVYVNIDKLGLHILKENSVKPIKEGDKFSKHKILFYFTYNRAQSLVGMDNDSLYLFNGSHIAPYHFESNDYIKENILAGGIYIDKDNFVLSTVTGGCLVVDKDTKKSIYTLNYQTGLPDDEVYSLGIDRNRGLWVLHEYGMSRVDLKLPVRNINNYPGLEGNLTSIIEIDTTIYVSTSEGVYYLSEVKNYDEIEVMVKVNEVKEDKNQEKEKTQKKTTTNRKKNKESNSQTKQEDEEEKKSGIFGKLFGKKKKKKKKNKSNNSSEEKEKNKENLTIEDPIDNQKTDKSKRQKKKKPKTSQPISKYEKQKIYALQSISHRFNKIAGIEGKAKQFLQFKDKILVAANTGLYQIENLKTTTLISGRYINYIYQAKLNINKFYIGTATGLLIAEYKNNTWEITDNLNDFSENVYSILELSKNNLWIGSENVAYNILFDNSGHPVNIKPYPIKSNFTERILVRNVFGIPYFFLSTGLYCYNAEKDSIVFNKKTIKGFTGQSKYIFSQDKITWIFNEYKWVSLHETSKYASLPEEFLELFGDVSNIYVDSKNNIWLIDNNNSIFKIINTRRDYEEIFDVYLKFINGKQGELLSLTNLVMDYDNNSLKFNISAPYFVRSNAISFQYYVEGLTSEWSDWRKDISIDFPYIPNGKYTLQIKAKNILGKETTIKTFNFEITPPYWKRWWFYFICITGLLSLIWIFIKYRERQMKRKQKLLEDKVEMRTQQLVKEQEKTEELLLNILPKETAEELKKFGKAKARHYDFASVMFTDFKGFTQLAEKLTSTDLVKEIDYCFAHFDDIIDKYHIEKIKTIGDAYMCAAGIPKENSNNPISLTLAGLNIIQFMNTHKQEREENNLPFFELRIGIHTGPLVAGVVGKKKFAYDIWGDTVNTAARMESSGEPGMLNVSESTYKVIEPYFECEFRGKIEAKNKGKIAMYFVQRIKEKYAQDKDGKIPNQLLLERISM
jgi:class 3 adenylate cyclase/ligand-binding sensor domain-containing protein